ncbi:hypothetical protein ACFVU0_13895 [Streptomyces sp. NPDC058122]|uniref:hypothetical protein n=1 Tax=Streptomyces sp. NPDC058122 TaxID=3346349 RepID=UPI0036E5332E
MTKITRGGGQPTAARTQDAGHRDATAHKPLILANGDGPTGDVAVGVGGLQVAAQQVGVEVLALEAGGEGADQEVVVGEGVGQGVQDQALPLLHAVAVQGLQVLGAGEVGVDAAAVVAHQRQQLRGHLVARRARGGIDRAGCRLGWQGVADLLQARVLLRTAGDLAAPLRALTRVGGGHGHAVLTAVPRSGA